MNKMVTSFWEGLSFNKNIDKIRKAVMDYLTKEGIKNEISDGNIVVEIDERYYDIEFNLEEEYPQCNICFTLEDDLYTALEMSKKTFIADKVNTDERHYCTAKAYVESMCVETQFYFADKEMLLNLFYKYFTDIMKLVDATMDLTGVMIQERKNRRPIGFRTYHTEKEEEVSNNMP